MSDLHTAEAPLNSTVLFTSCTKYPLALSSMRSTPKIPPPMAFDAFNTISCNSEVKGASSVLPPTATLVLHSFSDEYL